MTTSSDESSSQSPSVARTKNFSEEDGFGCDDPGLGRQSFRCVTTGVAVTYGGVFNLVGGGRIFLSVPAMNALYKLQMMGTQALSSTGYKQDIRNPRFLHFARPFIAGVTKSSGRLKPPKNPSAQDHIFSLVRRVFRSYSG